MRSAVTHERVSIPGWRGRLAGELAYPDGEAHSAILLLSPHPHMGGSMDNNLVKALAGELAAAGAVTLRFDYGGVGGSEGAPVDLAQSLGDFWRTGHAPEDPLMLEDAHDARRYLAEAAGTAPALVGYSFGAYVAARLALDAAPPALVMISPTVTRHDLGGLRRCAIPMLAIYSDNDFATPASAVREWLASIGRAEIGRCIGGGEHFFLGREREVTAHCRGFLAAGIEEAVA